MLYLRTWNLPIAFISILVLISGLLTGQTEAVSDGSFAPSRVLNIQGLSADLTNELRASVSGSSLDPCFDVSLSEARACRNEMKITIPTTGRLLDECFDVALMERARCRSALQKTVR